MLDVGWTELMVIGALALIVVGPRDLPQLLHSVGRWVGQIKRMAREFQRSLEDATRDTDVAGMKELRDLRKDLGSLDFRQQAAKAQSYLKQPVKVEPGAGAKPAQPAAAPGSAAGADVAAAADPSVSGAASPAAPAAAPADAPPASPPTPAQPSTPAAPAGHRSPGDRVSEG